MERLFLRMSTLLELVKQDFGITGSGRWWRSLVHSSLVVDEEKEKFFFNARNLFGGAKEYLINIRGISPQNAEEFVSRVRIGSAPNETVSLQFKYEKLVNIFNLHGKEIRDYWYRRNLTDKTIDRYKLGHYDGWFLVPIYNDGMFVNFQCRRDEPEKKIRFWYKDSDFSPVLFNSEILRYVSIIFITEGLVDSILLNQLGFPSVCPTNGAMSWYNGWIKYFSNIDEIYYIADNDSAGVEAAKRVSASLGDGRVKIFRFRDKPLKYDAVDFFREGNSVEDFQNRVYSEFVYGFQKGDL